MKVNNLKGKIQFTHDLTHLQITVLVIFSIYFRYAPLKKIYKIIRKKKTMLSPLSATIDDSQAMVPLMDSKSPLSF